MSAFKGKAESPAPRILANELSHWTFTFGETRYQADDTEHMFAWMFFVDSWADIAVPIDWEDLEERAHFLNMLYEWCEQHHVAFPLEEGPEKFTGSLNFSGVSAASEAN